MRRQWLVMAACFVLVAAVRADDKAADGDQKKMQGSWEIVSGERDGQPLPDEVRKMTTIVIEGNKMKMKRGDQAGPEMTFTLDSSKKPKTIDVDIQGKTGKGIYELDGDTLKIAHGELDAERPKDFKSTEGSKVTSVVLKRKKS